MFGDTLASFNFIICNSYKRYGMHKFVTVGGSCLYEVLYSFFLSIRKHDLNVTVLVDLVRLV